MRTATLKRPAEEFYASCDPHEREELQRIIHNICADPKVNNRTIFVLSLPPAIISVYRDANYWVAFRLSNAESLEVHNIARRGEPERLSRR